MLRHADIMPSVAPNAQYNVAAADSLPVKIAAHQRRKMFARFLADTGAGADDTVLDIGATSERTYEASNYLEAWYPHKDKVTAIGLDDASFLPALYPGMRFVQADALTLPFASAAFDLVHAAAVIEHIGTFERQCGLLRECCRVARRAVFVTTPNRWFPIEFHTVLPVVHWLPKPLFRGLMRRTGRGFFAEEANLNLMTARELGRAAAGVAGFSAVLSSIDLAGWPSNLLLTLRRDRAQA
jgi:Methyltransferase domain